ncbi:unnamed protein product [Acanthoscelides obtectus]|uniref:Uncharacterized protein n=1 Tax=Acanthoscelides obtectus TaxID=200917 RepID=A0A9P0Q901_ACAOB|nr:unnamed protein product [Acanthoscelides obtectus]CAK1684686.1 hypothetical protein AOBTE_LOCUS35032 [Acanthoscelides obtectus]
MRKYFMKNLHWRKCFIRNDPFKNLVSTNSYLWEGAKSMSELDISDVSLPASSSESGS